ncbi:MAG: replication initiator protein [Microviridae sp.]|nr:MAG: replication initiator protein [Microviridae sp.]
MERARQWGLRCLHEAKLWPHNQYVTLTYSDENLPPGGSVCLRDVQLFMKRLRKAKNSSTANPVRFFLGAEYGDENRRPHYHALLFNCEFRDKRFISENARGEPLFTSAELSELWPHGFNSIGAVTFDSAVYCAKYAMKKLNVSENSSDAAVAAYEARYVVYDADGIVYQRDPEFAVMSRRPGIGAGYYEKYGNEVRAHDTVIVNGREVRPPRFYDTRSERVDADGFARLKKKRKRMAVLAKPDNTPARLRVKQILMEKAAEKKERKL